jgi:elongation factor Ts
VQSKEECLKVSTESIKELREKSGAGVMECRNALAQAEGHLEKALELLKQQSLVNVEKKKSRTAAQGLIDSYVHAGGRIAAMVELNCETDFVAKTEDFQTMAKDLAMHVAASNPLYIRSDEIPEAALEREKEIYRSQLIEEKKPEKIWEKIIEGKLKKYFEEVCLIDQKFIKNTDITVGTLVSNMIAKTGENIIVRRFARFQLGGEQK